AKLHKTRDAAVTDEIAYAGWAGAKLIEQILQRLGDELTRERLFTELESTKKNPIKIDPLPPMWYGADRRYGSDAALPSRVENGNWVVTGEPASRFK
ncbi:MAG: hypothetical protein ACRDJ9_23095, partial [Dehalococcoidia bacterium]